MDLTNSIVISCGQSVYRTQIRAAWCRAVTGEFAMRTTIRSVFAFVLAVMMLVPCLALGAQADYYINRDGQAVHRPEHAASRPQGATARCRDGEYSFSRHHRGTCSGHGGVAQWYQ